MFNLSYFNRTAFNRQIPDNLYSAAILLVAESNIIITPRSFIFGQLDLSGVSSFVIDNTIHASISLSGVGALSATGRNLYLLSGSFAGNGSQEITGFLIASPDLSLSGAGTFELFLPWFAEISLMGAATQYANAKKILWALTNLIGRAFLTSGDPVISLIAALNFEGSFPAGSTMVINTENFTADLNGQDVTYLLSGNFFEISPGENTFEFSKAGVNIKSVFRDRYI